MQQDVVLTRKIGGKTVEERRSERWRRLIEAAVKVYGERGYRNSTVKAVCDAAGLTERYFYESFSNSEDLLCACFQEAADRLLMRVRRAGLQGGGAPMERVRAGVLEYLRHLQAEPAAARVFLIEMSSVSARADALVSASLDRFAARERQSQKLHADRDAVLEMARTEARKRVEAGRVEIEAASETARQQIEGATVQLSEQILQTVLPAGSVPVGEAHS